MRSPRDRLIAFFMLLPSLVLLAIFVYGFIGQTIQTSTTDWGRDQATALAEDPPIKSVGLENYENLMTDLLEFPFRNALVNTFFFTVFFVGGAIVLGFLLALLLDQRIAGEGLFRTTFLFPMALSFVVTGTIWRWMLQPSGGINALPERMLGLGVLDFQWTNSREVRLPFQWHEVPQYLTYLGLAVLGFLAFNALLARRWRPVGILAALAVGLVALQALEFWENTIWPRWMTPPRKRSSRPRATTWR
ncbi:MAG: sugar ABC transporter permease [Anaerolineae bacterium]|nr:sugar ABC transporter permease [Anaerolineae bacterium]